SPADQRGLRQACASRRSPVSKLRPAKGHRGFLRRPVFPPESRQERMSTMATRISKPLSSNAPSSDAWDDQSPEGRQAIAVSLNELLADLFALYLKTKNFHWHVSGPHFRDYHLL